MAAVNGSWGWQLGTGAEDDSLGTGAEERNWGQKLGNTQTELHVHQAVLWGR